MELVFIGFGSNIGSSVQTCREAVTELGSSPGMTLRKVSSLYRTEPVGMAEQAWFINGVVLCETSLEPEGLLHLILSIEEHFGRIRNERWGPRTLDLDILFFGDRKIDLPWLTVPHPRVHERRFVLAPMAEIAPNWVHPVFALTIESLLSRLPSSGQEVERFSEAS